METLITPSKTLIPPNPHMNRISTNLRTKCSTTLQSFSTFSINLFNTQVPIQSKNCRTRVNATVSNSEVNKNWLASLSCCVPEKVEEELGSEEMSNGVDLDWVIGIDPDLSGALALLKRDDSGFGYSAQVFDNPYVEVSVGKRVRKRLDANKIVQLLQSFDAPCGTTAYIEQSIPFPKDGKQGWWSGGFGYGMWIGVLVASGFSVVPVSVMSWKKHFELLGSSLSKDDSRKAATALFPTLSSLLTRKKDHGRAEALLIAAYGKGLKIESETPSEIKELCTTLT